MSSNEQRQGRRDTSASGAFASFPLPSDGGRRVMVQEEPTMRAVSMLAPPTAGIDMVKQLSIPRPSSGAWRKGAGMGGTLMKGGPIEEESTKPVVKSSTSNWVVSDDDLECLPDYFVLERTARFVGGTRASVVASRVSDCLRKRSVSMSVDEELKTKARCMSPEFVDFRVNLFAGRDEFSHGVIVEVQRRSGPSVHFRKECRAILDAAEDMPIPPSLPVVLKAPSKIIEKVEGEDLEKTLAQDSLKALESATKFIQSKRIDANLLGMESLSDLTDPTKTSPEVALMASKSIICEADKSEIRSVISSLVQFGVLPSEEKTGEQDDLHRELRARALIVLGNALAVISKNQLLAEAVEAQPWFVDSLVPLLLAELKDAKSVPHNALWAAKCLSNLCGASPDARRKALDSGALDVVAEARDYGILCHDSLANETSQVVSVLEIHC